MSERSSGARYSGKIETTSRRTVSPPSVAVELEQPGRGVDDDAAALDVHLGTIASTNGTSASRAAGQPQHELVLGGAGAQAGDLAEGGAGGVDGGEADELVLVPRVVLVARRPRRRPRRR